MAAYRLETRDDGSLLTHAYLLETHSTATIADFIRTNRVAALGFVIMPLRISGGSDMVHIERFVLLVEQNIPCVTRIFLFLPNMRPEALTRIGRALASATHVRSVEIANHYNDEGGARISSADAVSFAELVRPPRLVCGLGCCVGWAQCGRR